MNENHWYPRNPQKYLTDTAWCDVATEVAHVRMIDTYYAIGKPIKDEPCRIKLIGKIHDADYARVIGNLHELGWMIIDGFWRHKCIENVMLEMEEFPEAKNRSVGARSGKKTGAWANPAYTGG